MECVPLYDIYIWYFFLFQALEVDSPNPTAFVIEKVTNEPAFLTEHPSDILTKGKQNKVPIMMGYTNKEGMLSEFSFKMYTESPTFEPVIENFERKIPRILNVPKGTELSKNIAQKIKQQYFKNRTVLDKDSFYDVSIM